MAEQKNEPPAVKNDFRETQPDREKQEKDKKDLTKTKMVTQEQVKGLEAQRTTPQVTQQMTPGGMVEQSVNTQENIVREKKIEEMKRKLNSASQDMKKRFNRSR